MPACLIENQNYMHILSCLFAYKSQVVIHIIGVDSRSNHSRRFAVDRIDCPKNINPIILGLFYCCRTRSFWGPNIGQYSLLAYSYFVLEPDFNFLAGIFCSDFLNKKGACSNHCCIFSGLFLRCLDLGFRHENPNLCIRS